MENEIKIFCSLKNYKHFQNILLKSWWENLGLKNVNSKENEGIWYLIRKQKNKVPKSKHS